MESKSIITEMKNSLEGSLADLRRQKNQWMWDNLIEIIQSEEQKEKLEEKRTIYGDHHQTYKNMHAVLEGESEKGVKFFLKK